MKNRKEHETILLQLQNEDVLNGGLTKAIWPSAIAFISDHELIQTLQFYLIKFNCIPLSTQEIFKLLN